MKNYKIISFLIFVFFMRLSPALAGEKMPIPAQLPVPNTVTMIDLGATKCIPCKMMAPILVELGKEYRGRASVVFIDVWENPPMAKKFKIKSIPTQIFFDADGKEIFRHEGFFDKGSIAAKLEEIMGSGGAKAQQAIIELPVNGVANVIMIDTFSGSDSGNPNMDMLSDIQSLFEDQVRVIYSDTQKSPEIASRLKVIKTPSFILFDATGKEFFRFQGLLTKEQIIDELGKMNIRPKGISLVEIPARDRPTLLLIGDEQSKAKEEFLTVLNEIAEQYNQNLAVYYVDQEKYPELFAKFKPTKLPVFLVFDAQGEESFRHYGKATKEILMAQLLKIGIKP